MHNSPSPSKYAGRPGRVQRSANVGRFWDTQHETIISLNSGIVTTKTDFFNSELMGSKLSHQIIDQAVYVRRKCEECGKSLQLPEGPEIEVDHRGYAFCPVCATLYNDGKPPMRAKTSTQLIEKSRHIGHAEVTKSRKHFLKKISR